MKMLKSNFTFGFELEGTYNTSLTSRDDLLNKFNKLLDGRGSIHGDGSLRSYDDTFTGTFEYSSPALKYTPVNVNRVIKMLDSLKDLGVKINRSCGFHTHISYNGMSVNDVEWFLLNVANNQNFMKYIKFGRMKFYNRSYAGYQYLVKANQWLQRGNLNSAIDTVFQHSKYRVFRIHPQGTIEWRGPRTFLNVPTHKKTVSFFKLLDSLITDIINCKGQLSFDTNGNTYTFKDVLDISSKYNSNVSFPIKEKSNSLRKAIKKNIEIIKKLPLNIIDKHINNIIDELAEKCDNLGNKNLNINNQELFDIILNKYRNTWLSSRQYAKILLYVFSTDLIIKNLNAISNNSNIMHDMFSIIYGSVPFYNEYHNYHKFIKNYREALIQYVRNSTSSDNEPIVRYIVKHSINNYKTFENAVIDKTIYKLDVCTWKNYIYDFMLNDKLLGSDIVSLPVYNWLINDDEHMKELKEYESGIYDCLMNAKKFA